MSYYRNFYRRVDRAGHTMTNSRFMPEIKGTRINRSFVPWYSEDYNEYMLWRNSTYVDGFPTYSNFFSILTSPYIRAAPISFKCEYKNIPAFRIRVTNGIIYEWNLGFPKIHFLVSKNTGINPYQTEEVRYYISEEFFSSEKFKYIYKQVKKKILVPDQEATVVVHPNILPLFYDRIELPKFDNLFERIRYEENITDIILEENGE